MFVLIYSVRGVLHCNIFAFVVGPYIYLVSALLFIVLSYQNSVFNPQESNSYLYIRNIHQARLFPPEH